MAVCTCENDNNNRAVYISQVSSIVLKPTEHPLSDRPFEKVPPYTLTPTHHPNKYIRGAYKNHTEKTIIGATAPCMRRCNEFEHFKRRNCFAIT